MFTIDLTIIIIIYPLAPCDGVECGRYATCHANGREAACICDQGFTFDPSNISAGCIGRLCSMSQLTCNDGCVQLINLYLCPIYYYRYQWMWLSSWPVGLVWTRRNVYECDGRSSLPLPARFYRRPVPLLWRYQWMRSSIWSIGSMWWECHLYKFDGCLFMFVSRWLDWKCTRKVYWH